VDDCKSYALTLELGAAKALRLFWHRITRIVPKGGTAFALTG